MRAVIIHSGTYGSGHFVTVLRRHGHWYLTNDTEVTNLSMLDLKDEFVWETLYLALGRLLGSDGHTAHPRLALYERYDIE